MLGALAVADGDAGAAARFESLYAARTRELDRPADPSYLLKVYAKPGADYGTTSTIVTFGAGDAQPKAVVIPIINDRTFEGDEFFQVTLSDPSAGASLGAPGTASVTIRDDDPPPRV